LLSAEPGQTSGTLVLLSNPRKNQKSGIRGQESGFQSLEKDLGCDVALVDATALAIGFVK
jgi:hypothetical protein